MLALWPPIRWFGFMNAQTTKESVLQLFKALCTVRSAYNATRYVSDCLLVNLLFATRLHRIFCRARWNAFVCGAGRKRVGWLTVGCVAATNAESY